MTIADIKISRKYHDGGWDAWSVLLDDTEIAQHIVGGGVQVEFPEKSWDPARVTITFWANVDLDLPQSEVATQQAPA